MSRFKVCNDCCTVQRCFKTAECYLATLDADIADSDFHLSGEVGTALDNNPKAARALLDGKAPMDLIPYRPLAAVARVLAKGAEKYGIRNWREERISASTYIGAIGRHTLLEWAEGVDKDADDGEHPLAHVIACCLLVLDAIEHDTLIDDRGRTEVVGRENKDAKSTGD